MRATHRSIGPWVALVVGLAPAAASAGESAWSSTGPYGGFVKRLVIDPNTPTTVYVSARGGIYKSTTGGGHWERAQNGMVGAASHEFDLMIDADAPGSLYTFDAAGQLWRTVDGAQQWTKTGFVLTPDEEAVALSDVPGRVGEFYVATSGGEYTSIGRVIKTTNAGTSFVTLGNGLPINQPYLAVAVDPVNPDRVLVGTDLRVLAPTDPTVPGIFRSTDGGASWTGVYLFGPTGLSYNVNAITWGPGSIVYALDGGSFTHSLDDGATWQNATGGSAIALATGADSGSPLFMSALVGLYRVTNPASPMPIYDGPNQTMAPNPTYTVPGPYTLQAHVKSIVLGPTYPAPNASLFAVTYGAGLYGSVDAGANWSNAGLNDGIAAMNAHALAVHPNPAIPTTQRRIYAGFDQGGYPAAPLYRSNDGGVTWPTAITGLRASRILALALDPSTTGTTPEALDTTVVYAAGRAAWGGALGPASAYLNGGIYRSRDGGATWSTIDAGLPRAGQAPNDVADINLVHGLAIDPRSCGTNPTPITGPRCATGPLKKVYYTAEGYNYYDNSVSPSIPRTRNRIGYTLSADDPSPENVIWMNRETGLPQPVYAFFDPPGGFGSTANYPTESAIPGPIAIAPENSDVLYVGTSVRLHYPDVVPVPTIVSGVFKSIDGGAHWTLASQGLPYYEGSTQTHLDVIALATSPTTSNIAWAALSNRAKANPPAVPIVSGLYKTVDGGATWTSSSIGIPAGLEFRAVQVDADDGNLIYVATSGPEANPGGIYRSTDGGVTWTSISVGLPGDSALTLALDPVDKDFLHVGTHMGVWSRVQRPDADDDGVIDVLENNVFPDGDGNDDGVPDRVQPDVASSFAIDDAFPRADEGNAATSSNEPRGIEPYYTIAIADGGCARLNDVQNAYTEGRGRDTVTGLPHVAYLYPLRLVRFQLPNCAHAVIEVTYVGLQFTELLPFTDPRWSFRVYAPQTPGDDTTLGWFDLGARAQVIGPNRWRLTLDAAQLGSYRPDTNSILFVGGPAFNDDELLIDGFE